jgi:hypothetical protein
LPETQQEVYRWLQKEYPRRIILMSGEVRKRYPTTGPDGSLKDGEPFGIGLGVARMAAKQAMERLKEGGRSRGRAVAKSSIRREGLIAFLRSFETIVQNWGGIQRLALPMAPGLLALAWAEGLMRRPTEHRRRRIDKLKATYELAKPPPPVFLPSGTVLLMRRGRIVALDPTGAIIAQIVPH